MRAKGNGQPKDRRRTGFKNKFVSLAQDLKLVTSSSRRGLNVASALKQNRATEKSQTSHCLLTLNSDNSSLIVFASVTFRRYNVIK